MRKVRVIVIVLATVILAEGLLFLATVLATDDAIETGRLLAVLLDSGGATIEENQLLIDDSSNVDKKFTTHVFETKLIERFKDRTKINLVDLQHENVPKRAKRLLPALIDAMKRTVVDYQLILHRQGMGFEGFIHATFGTYAADKFWAKTGVYLKQVKIAPRNSNNAPDEYETKVLQEFASPYFPRHGDMIVSDKRDDGKLVRIMLPLFYRKSCLQCHGEPKGEKDISGYLKEGAKEGDLGGAISVKLMLK